jgi:hypothetical protein
LEAQTQFEDLKEKFMLLSASGRPLAILPDRVSNSSVRI